MATLHIPGGPDEGFTLRPEQDPQKLWLDLTEGEGHVEVLIQGRNGEAQALTVWAERLEWFSVQ